MHRPATRLRLAALIAAAAALATACTPDAESSADLVAPTSSSGVDVIGAAGSASGSASATPTAGIRRPSFPPHKGQLPRGGRIIFPRHTVVAYYGTAGTAALGVLGEGTPDVAAKRLEKAAAPFGPASGRVVLPAFELITTVAQGRPGTDGLYSYSQPFAEVQRYLDAARRAKMLLILDFQPGKADFLDQVRRYERFLLEPEVGVALDPEWKLHGNEKPLRQIGHTTAADVNRVSSYLGNLVMRNGLPEKLFIVHQFRHFMIRNRDQLVDRNGLATMVHVDGFGSQRVKREAYNSLALRGGPVRNAFKLFIDEDIDMMTPREAMALRPQPELISYQ